MSQRVDMAVLREVCRAALGNYGLCMCAHPLHDLVSWSNEPEAAQRGVSYGDYIEKGAADRHGYGHLSADDYGMLQAVDEAATERRISQLVARIVSEA